MFLSIHCKSFNTIDFVKFGMKTFGCAVSFDWTTLSVNIILETVIKHRNDFLVFCILLCLKATPIKATTLNTTNKLVFGDTFELSELKLS